MILPKAPPGRREIALVYCDGARCRGFEAETVMWGLGLGSGLGLGVGLGLASTKYVARGWLLYQYIIIRTRVITN